MRTSSQLCMSYPIESYTTSSFNQTLAKSRFQLPFVHHFYTMTVIIL